MLIAMDGLRQAITFEDWREQPQVTPSKFPPEQKLAFVARRIVGGSDPDRAGGLAPESLLLHSSDFS
jgi:hypothetical protein